jgi:ribosomal protein S18 acetylase RimI-like enzyme
VTPDLQRSTLMTATQPATIELAAFEPARLDDLVSMWRQAFEHGVAIVDPHPIAEQKQYFFDKVLPGHGVTCALEGGRLVGFVAASPESVTQLHVRVGWHRRGIGTRLLAWAQAQSSGSLWLYTFARNRVARAFYEHHGFVDIAHGFEPTWQLDDVKYLWTRPK